MTKFSFIKIEVYFLIAILSFLIFGWRNTMSKEAHETPVLDEAYNTYCFSKSDREQIIYSIFTSNADLNLIRRHELFPEIYNGEIIGKLLSSDFVSNDLELQFNEIPLLIAD